MEREVASEYEFGDRVFITNEGKRFEHEDSLVAFEKKLRSTFSLSTLTWFKGGVSNRKHVTFLCKFNHPLRNELEVAILNIEQMLVAVEASAVKKFFGKGDTARIYPRMTAQFATWRKRAQEEFFERFDSSDLCVKDAPALSRQTGKLLLSFQHPDNTLEPVWLVVVGVREGKKCCLVSTDELRKVKLEEAFVLQKAPRERVGYVSASLKCALKFYQPLGYGGSLFRETCLTAPETLHSVLRTSYSEEPFMHPSIIDSNAGASL